jgi:hypothetical protein
MEEPGEHKGHAQPTKQRANNLAKGKQQSKGKTQIKGKPQKNSAWHGK